MEEPKAAAPAPSHTPTAPSQPQVPQHQSQYYQQMGYYQAPYNPYYQCEPSPATTVVSASPLLTPIRLSSSDPRLPGLWLPCGPAQHLRSAYTRRPSRPDPAGHQAQPAFVPVALRQPLVPFVGHAIRRATRIRSRPLWRFRRGRQASFDVAARRWLSAAIELHLAARSRSPRVFGYEHPFGHFDDFVPSPAGDTRRLQVADHVHVGDDPIPGRSGSARCWRSCRRRCRTGSRCKASAAAGRRTPGFRSLRRLRRLW